MRSPWFSVGAVMLALGVAAGALGAHGLKAALSQGALDLWQTAVRYLWLGGAGLLAVGLAAARSGSRRWQAAGWMLAAGSLLFSGTVAALALGGPRWLGAITPIGGLLLILGFLAAAYAGARGEPPGKRPTAD